MTLSVLEKVTLTRTVTQSLLRASSPHIGPHALQACRFSLFTFVRLRVWVPATSLLQACHRRSQPSQRSPDVFRSSAEAAGARAAALACDATVPDCFTGVRRGKTLVGKRASLPSSLRRAAPGASFCGLSAIPSQHAVGAIHTRSAKQVGTNSCVCHGHVKRLE